MSTPTPSLREQGFQALQEGNLDKAVDCLARAVMANDKDADAKAFLGIAYSQRGLHPQARRALQSAVDLQPQNANFRFYLGVAAQRAGDTQAAAVAFRDTLQLNRDHAQARQKLQEMGPQVHGLIAGAPSGVPTAPAPQAPHAAPPAMSPPGMPSPGMPPPGVAPPMPPPGAPQMGAPMGPPGMPAGLPPMGSPMGGPPGMTPPMAPPGMGGGLTPQAGPPGTIQCPRCRQWTKPGLSCDFCSGPLTAPARPPSGPPVGQPAYAPGYARAARTEDDFNVLEGYKSWFQVLISPKAFFAEHTLYEGLKGPAAFLLAYALMSGLTQMIANLMEPGASTPYGAGRGFGALCGAASCGWVMLMLMYFVWAGLVHGISKLFGGQGSYAGSFRACAFASAPMCTVAIIGNLLTPLMLPKTPQLPNRQTTSITAPRTERAPYEQAQIGGPPSFPSPSPGRPGFPGGSPGGGSPQEAMQIIQQVLTMLLPIFILYIVGYLWSMVLQVIGVAEIHQVGTGAAVGVVLISNLISWALCAGTIFAFSAALVGLVAGIAGGAGQ
jgi:hypothetical protein